MAAKARSSGKHNTSPRGLFPTQSGRGFGKGINVRVGGEMTDSGLDYNPPEYGRSGKVAFNDCMRQGATSKADVPFRSGEQGEPIRGARAAVDENDGTEGQYAHARLFPGRRR